jgi:hypothetical protein
MNIICIYNIIHNEKLGNNNNGIISMNYDYFYYYYDEIA